MPRYSVCILYGGCRLAITRLYTLLYSICLLVPHKEAGDSMRGEEVGFYGGKGSDTVHLVRFLYLCFVSLCIRDDADRCVGMPQSSVTSG